MLTVENRVANVNGRVQAIAQNNVLVGVTASLAVTYFPFALTFSLSRLADLTAASHGESAGIVAGAGLVAALLAAVSIYMARKSPKAMLIIAGGVFAMLGVFASLTV